MSNSTQIDYYKLDKLEADSFLALLQKSIERVDDSVIANKDNIALDELAVKVFSDEVISEFLLLLARLPVFAKDFEELFKENLDGLQILKKLKFFINLKIRETLYLLVKLSMVFGTALDITRFFSVDKPSNKVQRVVDLKFHGAVRRGILFSEEHPKRAAYMAEFETLEKIEPHAIYPTSIYRQ